jgi:hypothetical protein
VSRPAAGSGQLGWSSPPLLLPHPQHLADFATAMGRKPLAGLRPRRPSRPSADQTETAAAAEDKSAKTPKKESKEQGAHNGNLSQPNRLKQRSRWRHIERKLGELRGQSKAGEVLAVEDHQDSGLDDSGPFSSGGDSLSGTTRSRSVSTGGGRSEDRESAGEEDEQKLFQKVSFEEQVVYRDSGGQEDQCEDVSDEPEHEVSLFDLLQPDIDPEVLKHFGEPLNDLDVEYLSLDPSRTEALSDVSAAGLPEPVASLPEVSLDEAVEEIITKIKSRSLLADRIVEMEETASARGATVDFAAFNWKPDVVFFQFGRQEEGGGQGSGPAAGLPPGRVFTFEKATPPASPAKKRSVQKPGRGKNGDQAHGIQQN